MRSKRFFCPSVVVLAAVVAYAVGLSAQEQLNRPAIIKFDAPGAGIGPGAANCFGSCPGTVAVNGNAEGAVTGYSVDDLGVFHGFVRYPDGRIKTFDVPAIGAIAGAGNGPGQGTVAYSINSEGAIAGQFQDASYIFHGFLRSPGGAITSFDIPGLAAGAFQGPGGSSNINDAGEIAGFYIDGNNVNYGFVRYPNGKIKTFSVSVASTLTNSAPQGTVVALESGLNAEGAITGWYFDSSNAVHGYVRRPGGTITLFDNTNGGTSFFQGTYGGSINNEGTITGGVLDSNYVYHGYVRSADGDMKTFDAPGAGTAMGSFQGTFGVGINQAGTITAYSVDASNVTHGAVRERDGHISIFDVKGAGNGNNQGTVPQGISAAGIVMGYYTDSNNVNHGFLLIPEECRRAD
jgi:hypothetical protein